MESSTTKKKAVRRVPFQAIRNPLIELKHSIEVVFREENDYKQRMEALRMIRMTCMRSNPTVVIEVEVLNELRKLWNITTTTKTIAKALKLYAKKLVIAKNIK